MGCHGKVLSFFATSSKTESSKPNDEDKRVRFFSSIKMTSLMEVLDSSLDFIPSIFGKSKSPGVFVPLLRAASMMLRISVLFMLVLCLSLWPRTGKIEPARPSLRTLCSPATPYFMPPYGLLVLITASLNFWRLETSLCQWCFVSCQRKRDWNVNARDLVGHNVF